MPKQSEALSELRERPKRDEPWTGMTIFGNRRPCIGYLPKKPKMPSSSKSCSTWQASARRSPITLRIVGQAGNGLRKQLNMRGYKLHYNHNSFTP